MVALTRDDAAQLRFTYDFQRAHGIALEWLSGAQARAARAASPSQSRRRGLQPERSSGRQPPAGARRCARAFLAAGGTLHEHTPVDAVEIAGGRVDRRARSATSAHRGRCRRARRRRLVGRDRRACRRGAAAGAAGQGPDAGAAHGPGRAAAAPRRLERRRSISCRARDGRLIVGATTEERGFDADLTAGGVLGAARRRVARAAGDRGTADRRDVGWLPPGLARRCADAGAERGSTGWCSPPAITATASC